MTRYAKCEKYVKGVFYAQPKAIKKYQGRYYLTLYVYDIDAHIKVDIHDSLCETLGCLCISSDLCKEISSRLPINIRVSNMDGYWQIVDESYILSEVLSKSIS